MDKKSFLGMIALLVVMALIGVIGFRIDTADKQREDQRLSELKTKQVTPEPQPKRKEDLAKHI